MLLVLGVKINEGGIVFLHHIRVYIYVIYVCARLYMYVCMYVVYTRCVYVLSTLFNKKKVCTINTI